MINGPVQQNSTNCCVYHPPQDPADYNISLPVSFSLNAILSVRCLFRNLWNFIATSIRERMRRNFYECRVWHVSSLTCKQGEDSVVKMNDLRDHVSSNCRNLSGISGNIKLHTESIKNFPRLSPRVTMRVWCWAWLCGGGLSVTGGERRWPQPGHGSPRGPGPLHRQGESYNLHLHSSLVWWTNLYWGYISRYKDITLFLMS